jgi:tetratricopeptide (TPR) repeat protein
MQHSRPFLLLVFLAVLALAGCTSETVKISQPPPEEVITCTPFPPVPGAPFTVFYHPTHPKALYPSPQPLFATVMITTQTGMTTLRVPLTAHGSDSLASPLISIPDNGVGINVSISPLGVYSSHENSNLVLSNAQEQPLRGGLPFAMRLMGQKYKEALSLFQQDAALYPDDYERYAVLWHGQIKSGMAAAPILHSIDSVWQYLSHQPQLTQTQVLGVVACAKGYAMLGKFPAATLALAYAHEHSEPTLPLRKGTINALHDITYTLLESFNTAPSSRAKDIHTLFEILVKFNLARSNFNGFAAAFMVSPMGRIDVDIVHYPPAIRKLYAIIGHELITLSYKNDARTSSHNYPGLWMTAGNTMLALGDVQKAATLYQIGYQYLRSTAEWVGSDHSSPVSIIPLGRYRSVYAELYVKIATLLKQPTFADSVLHWAWSFPITPFSKGSYASLACAQAECFLVSKNIDSAEKYTAIALHLGARTANDVFAHVQAFRRSHGMTSETMDALKNRTQNYALPPEMFPVAPLQVQSAHGTRSTNLAAIRDTTIYLFFSSKTCSVCRIFIPKLIPKIQAASRARAIIITDEPSVQARKDYGKDVELVTFEPDMQVMYGVGAFPVLMVVKNGVITERHDGLSQETCDAIIARLK